jgi:hypothetical protein
MSRDLSATIKAVVDAQYGVESHDVVVITLPATPTLPMVTLRCAGKTGLVINGELYQNNLRSISTIKFSLGSNADNTSIILENVSQSLGLSFTEAERSLDGASVVIKRAWLTDPTTNLYETDTLFTGVVDGVRVSEDQIDLAIVSDMSQRNARLGNTQITQRCRWVFNVNGSGIGPECGWQPAQGGDPLECDLVFDSPQGCSGHNNQHRFGGVPTLLPKDLPTQDYPENPGPGGYADVPTRSHPDLDSDYHPWREFTIA